MYKISCDFFFSLITHKLINIFLIFFDKYLNEIWWS